MSRRPEDGVALGVVMLLLLGLALLALAGSGAALAALALAGLDEQHALAFEAAEAGLARSLRLLAEGADAAALAGTEVTWPGLTDGVTTRVGLREEPPVTTGPPEGFSLGAGEQGYVTQRLVIVSDGRARRGAAVRLEQEVALLARSTGFLP